MSYKEIRGHEKAVERLEGAVKNRRVAHAYLFAGHEGIGKRLVARAFAAEILGGPPTPDRFFEIEKPKDKQVITIEQMRDLIRTLSFRHADSRVILINDADLMNEELQNAILKTLEEPPARTVLVLVTAVPTMLLPTIRSRCQTVLDPLGYIDLNANVGLAVEDALLRI